LGTALGIQLLLPLFPSARLTTYFEVVRPLAYGLLLTVCLIFGRGDERAYPRRRELLLVLCIGTLTYTGFLFAGGALAGFGRNPMDTRPTGLIGNAWSYLAVVLLREVFRGRAMTLASGKHRRLIFTAAVLVFTFCGLDNIKSLAAFSAAAWLDWGFTVFLPLLAVNAFLCYTARQGGLWGNLVFRAGYWGIFLFCPYLPDLPEILHAVFLYLALLLMFLLLNGRLRTATGMRPIRHWAWALPPAALAVLVLLFGLGFFPYLPVAVASGSMRGVFDRGALVVTQKVTPRTLPEITEGDIIQFQSGDISVVHRVVEISRDRYGRIFYVTKGDNNPDVDVFGVYPAQVIGFARWSVPWLGFPALLLSGAL